MNRKNKSAGLVVVICILAVTVTAMCLSVVSAVSQRRQRGELQPVILYIGEDTQSIAESSQQEFIVPDEENTPDYVVLREETEMRAIWVPYYSLYDVDKAMIEQIVADCKSMGANSIIFHVRPFGDAFYNSAIYPWSHYITGTQGEDPGNGFDPLQYAIDCAHANGMQLHAWVNPLRIQMTGGKIPAELSQDNPYTVFRTDNDASNDLWVVDYNDGKFYNPGEEGARKLIIDGMAEIAANYNVDGLHWDDYFYPANDDSFDDSISYQNYLNAGGTKTLIEWRTENINSLVSGTYNKIKAVNSNCVFGISPAGNINNCLLMGADVYEWGSVSGYVDYICPQVYWSFDSEVAPFVQRCHAWRELVTAEDVDFYIGLALYKAGTDADNGLWLSDSTIIADQIEYIRSQNIDTDGFMIFSYEDLFRESAAEAVAEMKEEILGLA